MVSNLQYSQPLTLFSQPFYYVLIYHSVMTYQEKPSQPMKVNIFLVAAIVMPLLLVGFIGSVLSYGTGMPYKLNQISSIGNNVLSTSNIDMKMTYLSEMQGQLANYHGNPNFWWPTAYTDIDQTDQAIGQTVTDLYTLKHDTNQMAYQQEIGNVDSSTQNIQTRINDIAGAYMVSPVYNTLTFVFMALLIAGLPTLVIFDNAYQKWYYQQMRVSKSRY